MDVHATQQRQTGTSRQTPASLSSNRQDLGAEEPRKLIAVIAESRRKGSANAVDWQPIDGWYASEDSPLDPGHARMLVALERVFPVRFERLDADDLERADGALVLGSTALAQAAAGMRRLVLSTDARHNRNASRPAGWERAEEERLVLLGEEPLLRAPLRGQAIHESAAPVESPLAPPGAIALARVEDSPVWWRLDGGGPRALDVSTFALSSLEDGQTLREHLRAGRFMGLLPLVHFLMDVLGEDGWTPPPLRAAFVVDDPNLHWPSYGFIDYRRLIRHATHHGYHVGFATVPLDGWLVNSKAASLLAENTSVLSLSMHGNDHVARELGRLESDSQAEAAIAQGLRRIAALERRSGLQVERILVPPHGACSQASLHATFRLGADGACISRPYPWCDGQPAVTPVAGWQPADIVAGGLPVLPRYPLSAPRADLALRALLGQPLILYGHHGDFAHGLDVLEQATNDINRLGDVQWGSLGWIARGNYSTRRLDGLLLVRMHARRIAFDVPHGVRSVQFLVDEPHGGAHGHRLVCDRRGVGLSFAHGRGVSEPLTVEGPGPLELTLAADEPLDPADIRARRSGPWPLTRRILVEGRDRLRALRLR